MSVIGAAAIGRLVRLDPRSDGRVFAEREQDGVRSWWAGPQAQACPCLPEQDAKLPLARCLPKLRRHAKLTILSYRPERRLVIELRDEQGGRVFKGYRKGRLDAAARRHAWAAAALAEGPLGAAPAPERRERECALAWPALDGRALELHPASVGVFQRLGTGLARMQRVAPWPNAPLHGKAEELAVLDELLASVERAGLVAPPGWRELRAALGSRPEGGEPRWAACHRDLHDGQLLLLGDRPVLLDFDLLCLADPLLDAANFLAHLILRSLQGLGGALEGTREHCGRALLDGLDRDGEPDFGRRLDFYQAASFLRLALVYALRPPWAHLSAKLLAAGARCLA